MKFALEKSGTVPLDVMSLSIEESLGRARMAPGVDKYISAFVQISCDGVFSDETITNYGIDNSLDWRSYPESMPELSDTGRGYQEYSVACNPTLLLLHIDQGTDNVASFVPFASPRVNCRAVKSSHIEKITDVIIKNNQPLVTATEDYSVFPYQVSVGLKSGGIEIVVGNPNLWYSSVLNRDPSIRNKIAEKAATIFDKSTVRKARRMVRFRMAVYPTAGIIICCSSVWNH